MLKRSLIIGTSVLALGAAPAYAFQGPTKLPDLPTYEESGAQVNSFGDVIETLSLDIQTVRVNLIDNSFTFSAPGAGAEGAVNAQQNNGSNNVLNAATGVVTGVGTGETTIGGDDLAHTNDVSTGAFVGTRAPGTGFGTLSEWESTFNRTRNNQAFNFGLYRPIVEVDDEGNPVLDADGNETVLFLDSDGVARRQDGTAVPAVNVDFGTKAPDRQNLLTDTTPDDANGAAFESFSGVANVQQNNGDANTMGQSQAVFANQGRQLGAQGQSGGVNNYVRDGGRLLNAFPVSRAPDEVTQFDTDGEPFETFDELAEAFADSDPSAIFGSSFPVNALVDVNTLYDNTIDNGAFDNAAGSFQIQQNNGNHNALGQSTQILANNLAAVDTVPGDLANNGVGGGDTSTAVNSTGVTVGTSVWDGDWDISKEIASLPGLILPQFDDNGEEIDTAAGFVDPIEQFVADTYGSSFALSSYEFPDLHTEKSNLIENSFQTVTGLVSIQQNNGMANTLGQTTQVAVRLGVEDDSQLLASANAAGLAVYNQVYEFGVVRGNLIQDSFTDFAGAANIQQNNGHASSMNQVIAINAGLQEDSPIFGEKGGTNNVTLEGTVARNLVVALTDDPIDNTITGSFNGLGGGFTGVANVSQNNGSSNVMNSAVAISVTGVGSALSGAASF